MLSFTIATAALAASLVAAGTPSSPTTPSPSATTPADTFPSMDLLASPGLNVTTCEGATWKWSGGTPPYNLTISTAQTSFGKPARFFVYENTCTSYTWTVDMPAGYEFDWQLTDVNSNKIGGTSWGNGDEAVVVFGGTTTECIGAQC